MNENDSDIEKPDTKDTADVTITIKKETEAETPTIKKKIGPKSKCKDEQKEVSSDGTVMLTAEKVMNKELELLHTPVVLKEESPEIKDIKKTTRKSNVSIIYLSSIYTLSDLSSLWEARNRTSNAKGTIPKLRESFKGRKIEPKFLTGSGIYYVPFSHQNYY